MQFKIRGIDGEVIIERKENQITCDVLFNEKLENIYFVTTTERINEQSNEVGKKMISEVTKQFSNAGITLELNDVFVIFSWFVQMLKLSK